jgi:TPR repeat protein
VPQDVQQATRLMGQAALADFVDAEVEYAIALFNGTGIAKDEPRAAALFRKAAMQGSPIAQNRLARIYRYGRGVPKPDPVQAIRWHLVSKAAGATDLELDDFMQKQPPEVRAAAEQAAKPWLDVLAASRPQ